MDLDRNLVVETVLGSAKVGLKRNVWDIRKPKYVCQQCHVMKRLRSLLLQGESAMGSVELEREERINSQSTTKYWITRTRNLFSMYVPYILLVVAVS